MLATLFPRHIRRLDEATRLVFDAFPNAVEVTEMRRVRARIETVGSVSSCEGRPGERGFETIRLTPKPTGTDVREAAKRPKNVVRCLYHGVSYKVDVAQSGLRLDTVVTAICS